MIEAAFDVVLSPLMFLFMAVVIAAICVAPIVVVAPAIGRRRALRLSTRVVTFVGLLHGFSVPANAIMAFVWRDRMYYSADPVLDFAPYMPFSDFATDPVCGGHLLPGFTEWHFVVVWLTLAIPVWLGTIVVSHRIFSGRPHRSGRVALRSPVTL
ncbi:MAG TPA: hypothetical protein VHU41_18375 [Thermoanaerobaculia bacterium]|jgi:hypothetical protein|nr:hypothetical protein [Thermoanaerobaculia bacterium]